MKQFRAYMEEARKSCSRAGAEDIFEDNDSRAVQKRLSLLANDIKNVQELDEGLFEAYDN